MGGKAGHPSDTGKTAYSYDEFLKFSNGDAKKAQKMWDESKPGDAQGDKKWEAKQDDKWGTKKWEDKKEDKWGEKKWDAQDQQQSWGESGNARGQGQKRSWNEQQSSEPANKRYQSGRDDARA